MNERWEEIRQEALIKKEEEDGPQTSKSIDNLKLNELKTFLIYDYHRVTELG